MPLSRKGRAASSLRFAQCAVPSRIDGSSSDGISSSASLYDDSDEDSAAPTEDAMPPCADTEAEMRTVDGEWPPGPFFLLWVDGNLFMFIASLVILLNMVLMVIEALNPDKVEDFFVLDQAIMCFYIVELLLKASLWRDRLLMGPCRRIAWNWLDLIIVSTGCVEMYIMPMLTQLGLVEDGDSSMRFTPFLRVLRLLRLARVLKILKVCWFSDFSWAEGERFQLFIMCVIAASCIIMGFEADFPHFFLWFYLEQIALAIFAFELLVRLKNSGWQFFCNKSDLVWNLLDFVIVVGGVIDQWMLPCYELVLALAGKRNPTNSTHLGKFMMMLRMARLLRILRLVRLIKNIPPLFSLLKGIAQAMAGVMWVLLLTSVLLYACTLLCVKLLRDGIVYGGEAPSEVVEVFPNVPDTFFTLFCIMNGNSALLEPVLATLPISKLVYAVFTIVSSWAMLSILTAVVSENMITSTEKLLQEEEEESKQQKLESRRARMNEIFDSLDIDGDGEINYHEFLALLECSELRDEVCSATQMTERELRAVFTRTQKGKCVTRAKFLENLEIEGDMVTVRTVLRLENHLETLQDEVGELKGMLEEAFGRKSVKRPHPELRSRGVSREAPRANPASSTTTESAQPLTTDNAGSENKYALIDQLKTMLVQQQQQQQQPQPKQQPKQEQQRPGHVPLTLVHQQSVPPPSLASGSTLVTPGMATPIVTPFVSPGVTPTVTPSNTVKVAPGSTAGSVPQPRY